jgi:hypothetical protein
VWSSRRLGGGRPYAVPPSDGRAPPRTTIVGRKSPGAKVLIPQRERRWRRLRRCSRGFLGPFHGVVRDTAVLPLLGSKDGKIDASDATVANREESRTYDADACGALPTHRPSLAQSPPHRSPTYATAADLIRDVGLPPARNGITLVPARAESSHNVYNPSRMARRLV